VFNRSLQLKALHVLCVALASASVLACGDGLGDATGSTCPEDSTLTYANFGQAFIQSNCLSCHGSGGPESPTLATLEQVQSHIDEIDRAAAAGPNTTNTFMPEGASVSTEERRKLGEWLACGAR
jgi:mono/diheme cytochrome c family protein